MSGQQNDGPQIEQQIEQFRNEVETAVEADNWERAFAASVDAIFLTALKLCGDAGAVKRPLPEGGVYDFCASLRADCDQYLEAQPDDFRVVTARHAFDAVMDAQGFLLRGALNDPLPTVMSKLMVLGARLGHVDMMLTMVTTGLWDEFGEAKFKLHSIGSPRRNHRPQWEVQFLDEARRFISAMGSGATMGGLVRRAKTWAKEREKQGDSLEVPKTDDGIKAGIRRMRQRGEIILPKRGG